MNEGPQYEDPLEQAQKRSKQKGKTRHSLTTVVVLRRKPHMLFHDPPQRKPIRENPER